MTGKGLQLDPESWTGHYFRALALYGLNRLGDAGEDAHEALRRKPDFAAAYLLLAKIHSTQRDFRALVSDLNEYLLLDPDGPDSAAAKTARKTALALIAASTGDSALARAEH